MTCPLCEKRKGKRLCPGKGESICTHCCGTQRLVTIPCPRDCIYLTGEHAPAWEGRETERRRDALRIAPYAQDLPPGAARVFFLALVGITGLRRGRSDLTDALLFEAVTALRKTVATRTRGVLYDHQPADLRAVGLWEELRRIFEARAEDGRSVAPDDADLLPALEALEASLGAVLSEGAGPAAFLGSAERLVSYGLAHETETEPRRLIVEP